MEIRIGELAQRTGCEVVTIRYYEKEGLLPEPARSSGNYRLYGEEQVKRMQFIRHCRSLDMSLGEIRTLLNLWDSPTQDCGKVNALLDDHIRQVEARVEALLQLRLHLTALREKCAGARPVEACGILQGLVNCSCHTVSTETRPALAFSVRFFPNSVASLLGDPDSRRGPFAFLHGRAHCHGELVEIAGSHALQCRTPRSIERGCSSAW